MLAQIPMTLLKNAKNGQNGHHSIESAILSQSLTVKGSIHAHTISIWGSKKS